MIENIFLESENIYLKPLEEQDISNSYLNGINNQDRDIYTDHAIFPKNILNLKSFFHDKSASADIWLGIFLKLNNKHIGNIEISDIEMVHRKANYSIIIWSNEGEGHGFSASFVLFEHAFSKLNLNRISLSVNSSNKAAVNLYKKLGFIEEGLMRESFIREDKKYDFLVMGLLRKDFLVIKNKRSNSNV